MDPSSFGTSPTQLSPSALFRSHQPSRPCVGHPTTGEPLSDVGTGILQTVPNLPPANAVHRVGTSTGLDPATHAVYILLVPIGTNCPAYEQGVATLNANGSFSGDLELPSDPYSVRAVAVAAPIGTVVSCVSTDACVAAAGYLASSNALEIAK